MTGTDFFAKLRALATLDKDKRVSNVPKVERLILDTFLDKKNIPPFMWNFVPVTFSAGGETLTLTVSPDYLCIGDDQDFLRMPMKPGTAQQIADNYNCMLPTSKMVDAIFAQAAVNLEIITGAQLSAKQNNYYDVAQFKEHNDAIEVKRKAAGHTLGTLIDNLKKDLIATRHLADAQNRGILYFHGWHESAGKGKFGAALQTYTGAAKGKHSHDVHWVDYSHGARLVKLDLVSSTRGPVRMADALQDAALAKMLNLDGTFDPAKAKYDYLPKP